MEPKVSVITPIYNVAKFLPQCLDSLVAQTLDDIEFICVNDGSTDNSLEILNEYAARDSRFVVIDKPNGGYGHTMNTGINAARGEYIGIVESDDWIYPEAFEKLYALAEKHGHCDIIKGNHNVFVENQTPSQVENFPQSLCDRVLSPLDEDGAQVINSIPAIWAAIYRREFLNNADIRFLETPGASFQDTGFVFKSWLACDSFVLTHDSYLNYRLDNAGSSVQSAAKVMFVVEEFASIELFLSAMPERYDKLIGRVLAKKFDTYNWNYERIAPEFREEFLQHVAGEFTEPFEKGQVNAAYFKPGEYDLLCRIMQDPHAVFEAGLASERRARITEKPRAILGALGSRAGSIAQGIKGIAEKRTGQEEYLYAHRKVSIVIPVYNSEEYLAKTLESLLKQTHENLEIICVNDGSKDNSLAVINRFASNDARIVVIDKENGGPSRARNIGIQRATGDYLFFVDSDDFITKSAVKQMVTAAEENNAEVVIFGIDEYRDDTHRYHPMHHAVVKNKVPAGTIFDPRNVDNFFVYMVGFTVNKLYRMSYFKSLDLEFPTIGAHEDMPFTYAAVAPAHRVFYLDKVLYHYRRERAEGSRSDDTEEQFQYMLKALEYMRDELEKRGILEDYRRDFDNYVAHMCCWKFGTIFKEPRRQFYDVIRNGWLENMGVFGHDGKYFFDKRTREFMNSVQNETYVDMVENHAEQLAEELYEVYNSKSFRLSEMIAAPVRKIRGNVEPEEE